MSWLGCTSWTTEHWPRPAAWLRGCCGVRGRGRARRPWSPPELPSADPLQDNHPLASLPLLGYSLTIPSEAEDIHKDYVFKLHFKSHVYYFRAESEYTFERYVPSAQGTCRKTPLLS